MVGLAGLIAATTDITVNGATPLRIVGFVFPLFLVLVSFGLLFGAYQRDRWTRYDAHTNLESLGLLA